MDVQRPVVRRHRLFSGGTLDIANGGTVTNTDGFIGYGYGSTGAATLSGAGSTWTNSGSLYVGGYDDDGVGSTGTGTLNITDGGAISSTVGVIGYCNSGSVTVSGAGSTWANSSYLYIGHDGSGWLHISNGGAVGNTSCYIGTFLYHSPADASEVTVSGSDSTWTNSGALYLGCGEDSDITMEITDGGAVSNSDGYIGHHPMVAGASGVVTVTGAGSIWANSGELVVGLTGDATLSIADGGLVSVARDLSIGNLFDMDTLINIGPAGELLVTEDVALGDPGVIEVGGLLAADGINVMGGSLTNSGAGVVGTARLTVSAGVVNAAQPVTITNELTIGSEPVISVTNALFSVKGADLLSDPVRELTLQGGQLAIDSGGLAINMPGTDLIVADDTILDLGAATSATFDELVFGTGSILIVDSDSPVSLFFVGISGEGELAGSYSDVTLTGFLSPGETGRVLTIERDVPADAVADYLAMLDALGYAAGAENVAMAYLDGVSYPVTLEVPEPATLSLLFIGALLAVACRRRLKLSRKEKTETEYDGRIDLALRFPTPALPLGPTAQEPG